MKKLLLLLPLLMASCQKPYEKAIDEYYQSHLHDPSSYELVKMVGPDSVTVTSLAVFELMRQKDLSQEEQADLLSKYLLSLKMEGNDVNKLIGYRVLHEYRATNKVGALTLHRDIVYLDTTLTKVSNVESYDK